MMPPILIFFLLGFLVIAVVRNITSVIGWRQGKTFALDRPFEFYWPFVRVTWDDRRFRDGLWVVDLVVAGLLGTLAFNSIGILSAVAFIFGSLIARLIPYLSNVGMGLIDRYNIDSTTIGGKPAPKSRKQVLSKMSAEQANKKPEIGSAAPTGQRKSKSGGWRNTS